MTTPLTGKLDAALEKALADEVKEITKRHKEDGEGYKKGDYVYGVVDRTRVYDRALKLEFLKAKIVSPEWGKAFEKGPNDEK